MTTYDNTGALFEPEAYDDFRRRDWACYIPYWLATGASAQEYVDRVADVKQKVRDTIEDRVAGVLGFIEWLRDDSDPLE